MYNPWTTVSSKTVYKNQFIQVVANNVIRPNGTKGVYGFVKTRKTVGIIAVDDKMNFYLCKQFRYIFEEETLEIPRGFVDKNETSKKAAIRELAEEAKLASKKIEMIGSLRPSAGLMDEEAQIFLAREVKAARNNTKDTEKEIRQVLKYSFESILSMIRNGKIKDGLTIGSILLYIEYSKTKKAGQ